MKVEMAALGEYLPSPYGLCGRKAALNSGSDKCETVYLYSTRGFPSVTPAETEASEPAL